MGNSRSCHEYILREMPHRVRELHVAVKSNDRNAVRTLVAQGVNINFPYFNPSNPSIKDGNTPLIIAVSLNYTEIVEVLLRAGAYINKCDKNGCTPIYKAAFHGRPTLIELLARAGADVNLGDFQGKTPLYICVNNAIVHSHSCRSAILKLLAAGAIVDKSDKTGQAPIHIAAHWKLVDILNLLITARSNVNIIDNKGRTPLYICVSALSTKLYAEDLCHQFPCIVTLFRAGADMLNLIEWLLYKGPGISEELLNSAPDFRTWYAMQIRQPLSLKNMCRKAIQMRICTSRNANLVKITRKLPIPLSLQGLVCRKMFYREEHYYDPNMNIQNATLES